MKLGSVQGRHKCPRQLVIRARQATRGLTAGDRGGHRYDLRYGTRDQSAMTTGQTTRLHRLSAGGYGWVLLQQGPALSSSVCAGV